LLFGNRNNRDEERRQVKLAAGELAGQHYDENYNCTQSVILSAARVFGIEVPVAIIKGAAPFSGGIGHSGCTCGALVGASMFIGIVSADDKNPRKSKRATSLSGKFHDIFKDSFNTTCCRSLRNGLKRREAKQRCREITVRTAELLADMLANEIRLDRKLAND